MTADTAAFDRTEPRQLAIRSESGVEIEDSWAVEERAIWRGFISTPKWAGIVTLLTGLPFFTCDA